MDTHDTASAHPGRRIAMRAVSAAVAAGAVAGTAAAQAPLPYADPPNPALPRSTMELVRGRPGALRGIAAE